MSFGDKYKLQLQADALIVQKGNEAEKTALRTRLNSELAAYSGKVHGNDSLEGVLERLKNVNLQDRELQQQIQKFIDEERKLKGGNMGEEFEAPARIFETYSGLAQNANNLHVTAAQVVTARAREEVKTAKGEWTDPNSSSQRNLPPAVVPQSAPNTPVQSPSTRLTSSPEMVSKNESIAKIQAANVRFIEANTSELQKFLNEGGKTSLEQGAKQILDALEAVLKDPNNIDRISKLQELLQKAGKKISRNGSTDGQFGNMTLEAVIGMFGVKKTRNSTPQPSSMSAPAGAGSGIVNPTAAVPSIQPVAPQSTSAYDVKDSKEQKAYLADKQAIEQAYKAWQESTKKAKDYILSSKEEIVNFSNTNDTFLKALFEKMSTFEQKHLVGKKHTLVQPGNEYASQLRNEVAAYYRGVGSVDNKHYRNPIIALSLLAENISMKLPTFPDDNTLFKSLSEEKKQQLITLVNAKMQGGAKKSFAVALSEVLGNPMIKGSWDKVEKDALETYNKDIVTSIEKVDESKLNAEQKASLEQLKDMYGVGGKLWGAFNWKDRNVQSFDMIRDQFFAIGLGAAGAFATFTGVGAIPGVPMMAISASALIAGGLLTTGATMTLEGREYGLGKFTRETAINAATFGAGGFVFKAVRGLQTARKIGVSTAIAMEGAGDVLIGVGIDQTRAYFEGVDVSLVQSFQENLAWALLPMAIRGKGLFSEKRTLLAQNAAARANEAQARQALGDTAGAEEVMRKTDAEIQAARREAGEVSQVSQVFEAAEMGPQPRAVQKASRPRHEYTEEQITANKTLAPEARLVKAEEILGGPLTDIQKTAIMDAHAVSDIAEKARILKKAGFNTTQRSQLLESGVCGVSDAVIAGARNFRENVTSTPLDKLSAQFKDSINGLKDGASLEISDIKITRQGNGFILKQEGKELISYTRTKQGTEAMVQVVDSRISSADYIKLATNEALNGRLSKNLGKEIVSDGATFRLKKDGDAVIFEKKLDDGGFQKMTEAEVALLSPTQVDAILGKLTDQNTLSWIKAHTDKPFQNTPAFEKIKDVKVKDFMDKFFLHNGNGKDFSWAGARIPKHMYDWSIGKIISELGHSLHLPGIKKIEVLRTLVTGKSSHGNVWSHHGSLFPTAWTPSLGTIGGVGLVTAVEAVYDPEGRSVNQILSDELIQNYFNFIYLGSLGSVIVELSESSQLGSDIVGKVSDAGNKTVLSAGADGSGQTTDGLKNNAKAVVNEAGRIIEKAGNEIGKLGSDGSK